MMHYLQEVLSNDMQLEEVPLKSQTPEICLAAVTRWGNALQYVKEQTPKICLYHIRDRTLEICRAA